MSNGLDRVYEGRTVAFADPNGLLPDEQLTNKEPVWFTNRHPLLNDPTAYPEIYDGSIPPSYLPWYKRNDGGN